MLEIKEKQELESYGLYTLEDINNEIDCTIDYLELLKRYREHLEKVGAFHE